MKKGVCITLSIVIAVLAVFGLVGFVLKLTIDKGAKIEQEKKQEFDESVLKVDSSSNTFTCLKEIMDQDEYTVYIEQKISYDDEDKISEYYAKTVYEFDTRGAYESMKDKLSKCVDTYESDSYIKCDINKNDVEKSIIGGRYKYYREQLEGQGFICE